MLIIGNDKLGKKLIHCLETKCRGNDIYLDKSTSVYRIIKLLLKKRIGFRHFFKMYFASMKRPDIAIQAYPAIRSNEELHKIILKESPKRIYFFRAGLVINKTIIDTGIDLFNVHCASILQYGGLASIARAIEDKSFKQEATMHRITSKIDCGEVIKVEPYQMKQENSYLENEDIAYNAGIRLLLRELDKN